MHKKGRRTAVGLLLTIGLFWGAMGYAQTAKLPAARTVAVPLPTPVPTPTVTPTLTPMPTVTPPTATPVATVPAPELCSDLSYPCNLCMRDQTNATCAVIRSECDKEAHNLGAAWCGLCGMNYTFASGGICDRDPKTILGRGVNFCKGNFPAGPSPLDPTGTPSSGWYGVFGYTITCVP